jgi:hypothetical protein
MNMVGNLAGALGSLLAGNLLGQTVVWPVSMAGNQLLFIIYACCFGLAALCWQGVDVTRTLADPERPQAG